MVTKKDFFEESSEQSQVKSSIVFKYFNAWVKVIISSQDRYPFGKNMIAYIDLFSGPGHYDDGTKSTPLLILEKAITDEKIKDRLVTIFNDRDPSNAAILEKVVESLPGLDKLKYKPIVHNYEVGDKIAKMFEKTQMVPTLFFVDPWGYKGLSLRLLSSILKDWGCDCIFFFNYNRINMGLNNDMVREHMDALFGRVRADDLRMKLSNLDSYEREINILEEICKAIRKSGPQFVLPFCFKDCRGRRTSHHLIFVSKSFKGYEIMKEIMAKESMEEQGVPKFEYNPVESKAKFKQLLLFQLSRPLDDLKEMLLKEFAGQTIKMKEVYERHSINRPYVKKNYKEILIKLEDEGKIEASKHRKGTFGDNVTIKFPI